MGSMDLHRRGGSEGGAVENPRRFVADLLEDASHGALFFRDAFFARGVRGLADAGDERERAVERPDNLSNADLFWRAPELVAAVRALAALDEAPMLQREQDVLEEFLRNGFLLGEVADEDGPVALFLGEQDHGLQTVLSFARQH